MELPKNGTTLLHSIPEELTLLGYIGTEPHSIDKALGGPNAKEWQSTLDYKISELEKLETWVIEDLSKGHTAIPCSIVLNSNAKVWFSLVQTPILLNFELDMNLEDTL